MPAPHYSCVGVGVGPANLSLASLLYGRPEMPSLFLEKKATFGWHDGQQMPGATLQVSPLKDLVTLIDPTNPFSFLSYLHSQGRIYHFINAQFDAVPRQEFRNYMEWASRKNENIVFGEEVLSVEFRDVFLVRTATQVVTADNLVIGVGTRPWVPPIAPDRLGDTQFHVADFVARARKLGGKRVAVVGGGQSGAEAVLDLISRSDATLPRRVLWFSRRANYLPLDDSPFTNDYYMPCHAEHFFGLERARREAFNERHLLTSDGISESTLRAIYQRIYQHRFIDGTKNLVGLYPNREITQVTGDDQNGWDITITHNDQPGTADHMDVDVIIWATGQCPADMSFLDPLADRLESEGDEYRIDRDFAVRWDGPADRNIFLQNAARTQRGLADPNLSLLAWRSQRIMDRLRGVRSENQVASFIEWSANVGGADFREA